MNQHEKEIPSTTPDENKETAQDGILDDDALNDVSGGNSTPKSGSAIVGFRPLS